MAQYTPEYQPTGDEVAVITTSKGTVRVQLAGKDAPSTWQLRRAGAQGLLRRPEVPPPRSRLRDPRRLPEHARPHARRGRQEGRQPVRGPRHGRPGYSIKEEFSTNPNNKHLDARWPWRAPRIPTPPARSSTCAWRPAHAGLGLHGVRPDDRRHGRHRPAARRRRDRERRDRERRRIAIRDAEAIP